MSYRLLCLSGCLFVAFLASVTQAADSNTSRPIYHQPTPVTRIEELDLSKLSQRLIDVLAEMHVEKDPDDPQFGLIYETYDPAQHWWVEGEGRDTMHHMMWTMVGLTNAYRATGDQHAISFLKKYPYQFYLRMMLNGEKLFGGEYGNGFCPYYWDDGDAIELGAYLRGVATTADRVQGTSPMSSVHLAQDLSVGHLDLWWLLGDPRLRQASADLYRQVHSGKIAERFAARNYALNEAKVTPKVDLAKFRAAEAEGKAKLLHMPEQERLAVYAKQFPATYGPIITVAEKVINRRAELPQIEPPHRKVTETLASLRLHDRKSGSVPAFPDDHAFDYYMELSRGSTDQPVRDWFARDFTMECLTRELLNEYWMDDMPYQPGYAQFPAFLANWNLRDGRYTTYHSQTPRHYWHTRGLHYSWLAAIALQMMEEWPRLHEEYREHIAPQDPVVRFTDQTPTLDGKRDDSYATVEFPIQATVSLASDPLSLFVFVKRSSDTATVTIHGSDQAGEQRAAIQIAADGTVTVANGAGEPLLHWSQAGAEGVEIQIPFQVYRPQGNWMTAVEHSRHRVELGLEARTVYFLSDVVRIRQRLQTSVESAIVHHAQLLDKQGWLPYAIADKSKDRFTQLSFSGAYGHLIHAIAQYQLWKQGKRDWEVKQTVHTSWE